MESLLRNPSNFSGRKTNTPGADTPHQPSAPIKSTRKKKKAPTSLGHLKNLIQSPAKEEIQITTDVAAQVVKQYLLPMFEQPLHHDTLNLEPEDGVGTLEPLENTVYGELKKAEKLSNDLTKSKEEYERTTQRLKDAQQYKESIKAELDNLKSLQAANLAEIQELKNEQESFLAQEQQESLEHLLAINELTMYQNLKSKMQTTKEKFLEALHTEKANNDKLKNKASELGHSNGLLKMENDIMAERLKGLYDAIYQVQFRHFIDYKSSEEFGLIAECQEHLGNCAQQLKHEIIGVEMEKGKYEQVHDDILQMKKETITENKKVRIYMKDKFEGLKREKDEQTERLTKLTEDFQHEEKLAKDLQDQYDKLKQRAKQYRQRRNTEQEEKQCKNCNQYYLENENYNWSCRTHASTFSGEVWWCCGAAGETALGCISAKHLPREEDEDDELEEAEREEMEKEMNLNTKCYSCRDIGHQTGLCDRDPNLRSFFDQLVELTRVKKVKKKNLMQGSGDQDVMNQVLSLDMLGEKMQGFNDEADSLDSEIYDLNNIFFEDVKEMRNQLSIHLSENMMDVSEIYCKEGEKESQVSMRLKSSLAAKSMGSRYVGSMRSSALKRKWSKMNNTGSSNTNSAAELLSTENAPTARSISTDRSDVGGLSYATPTSRQYSAAKIVPEGELLLTPRTHRPTNSGVETDEDI